MNRDRLMRWAGLFVLVVIVAGCQPATDNTPNVPTPVEGETPSRQEAGEEEAPVTATPTTTPVPTEATVTPTPPAAGSADDEALTALQAARADLARRLEEDPEAVEMIKVEEVRWPDASLGCPLPGAEYEQKATTGYVMVVEANGERYEYHTDAESRLVLCDEDGRPVLPTFPVWPGEIDDGEPWMPVDPLPSE